MDIKAATRLSEKTERSVLKQRGGGHVNNKICTYWLAGKCNRNPCRFLHRESPHPQPEQSCVVHENRHCLQSKSTWRNPNYCSSKKSQVSTSEGPNSGDKSNQETQNRGAGTGGKSTKQTQRKLCEYWVADNCVKGDKCQNLHSWFCGKQFMLLAKLEGHNKAVTGITLPFGSDKLYSSGKDKSVHIWDCCTGQCAQVVILEDEIGSLICEGPWVFVGLPNAIKAWNIQAHTEITLNGPVGQVYAMVVDNGMLFAGTEDGNILAWKSGFPALAASLKGHRHAVLSLVVGALNRLYSGSMDNTIRVWDLETLQCMHTLNGHTEAVSSVLCWDCYLLSGSLDNTIKVWAATESGNLEVVYEHIEEHGVLALRGIVDAEAEPILLCSCNDNSVRLYDLPSFTERGRIFSKGQVQAIQIGIGGLFFTGDATGQLFVWKLLGESSAQVASASSSPVTQQGNCVSENSSESRAQRINESVSV